MKVATRSDSSSEHTPSRTTDVADVCCTPLFPSELLSHDAVGAAQSLLGAVLVSTVGGVVTAGRIVETEAYFGPGDPASHAAARTGRTFRNRPMYGAPGTSYVYRIYGMHRCFNVVTDAEGVPSAVLIRALEPITGASHMADRRGRSTDLCSGPGRAAQAFGITEALNGQPLSEEPLTLHQGRSLAAHHIATTGRVGVSRAPAWPLRFFVKRSPSVSRARVLRGTRSTAFVQALQAHRSELDTLGAHRSAGP